LGPGRATELAQAMLDDTVERCAASTTFRTGLWAADARDVAWFRERHPELARHVAQEGRDLGERMARFFERELVARPRQSAVIVGSDAPLLELEAIDAAHRALDEGADLVLVPDDGGGYALVGLARSAPDLFTRVAMSTDDMLTRTLAVARELGFSVELLAPSFDIDTPQDFERLRVELAARLADGRPVPNAVAATLRRWGLLA
ncbi:MAG: glycosyltransferase, partial [Planctomycetes bacterium]|nr:glycosyltransferase [Planctomycetota bacterium]